MSRGQSRLWKAKVFNNDGLPCLQPASSLITTRDLCWSHNLIGRHKGLKEGHDQLHITAQVRVGAKEGEHVLGHHELLGNGEVLQGIVDRLQHHGEGSSSA